MDAVGMWNSKTLWRRVEWVAALATAFSALFTLVLEWKPAAATLTILAAGCVFLAKWRVDVIEARVQQQQRTLARRVVRRLLEALRGEYFSRAPEAEWHFHRVTLYYCRSGDNEGEPNRLEIFARAGVFEESQTCWLVDPNRLEGCEGIAGWMWFVGSANTPAVLPPWPEDAQDTAGQQAHAQAGRLSEATAQRLNVKSVAFSGVPVIVWGEKWGLLLLDSRQGGLISRRKEHVILRYAQMLGRVLEECLP